MSMIIDRPTFEDETAAAAAFDKACSQVRIDKQQAFTVLKEVPGHYTSPKVGAKDKSARIDRLIIPSPKLRLEGWAHGPFGVEIKRSTENEGQVVSQALDYANTVWHLGEAEGGGEGLQGFHLQVEWIFIYPFGMVGPRHGLGSVMAQNRIGWVDISMRTPFRLGCEQTTGFVFNHDGSYRINPLPMGRKRGSR